MAHLHKLEKWRNQATRERAIIAPVFGTSLSVSMLIFDYRQRYAKSETLCTVPSDARQALSVAGFKRVLR